MRGLRNWWKKMENSVGGSLTGRRLGPNWRCLRRTCSWLSPSLAVSSFVKVSSSENVCQAGWAGTTTPVLSELFWRFDQFNAPQLVDPDSPAQRFPSDPLGVKGGIIPVLSQIA